MEANLLNAVSIIVNKFDPEKIILFGSRASGSAKPDSDYDLCILKSGLTHRRKMAQAVYRALLQTGLPIDVIVESPEMFNELKENPFLVYNSIAKCGEIIYEKS